MGQRRPLQPAKQKPRRESRGQSITEMALVLPILLALIFGVFELGRILFIYSAINNASRETARFGAATGLTNAGQPNYLDCASLRQTARETAILAELTDGDIQIAYDKPISGTMTVYASCGDPGLNPADIAQGDRILITISKTVEPIIPIPGFPDFPLTFSTARTIQKEILIGPVECSDGLDNDGDGLTDWDGGAGGTADTGCSGPNDTTEAFCNRLTVVSSPPEGGTLSILPDPNCANRYIEQTLITLNGSAAEDYKFVRWSGSVLTTTNPTQFLMDGDKDVIAEFRLLEADLVVSKTASPNPVYSENSLSYVIDVANLGPDPARTVLITDTLPAGVQLQSWRIDSGDCPTATNAELLCQIPSLPAGGSIRLSVDVIAPSANNTSTTITNTVLATARDFDPNPTDNSANAAVLLLPRAELTIVKSDSADPVYAGDTVDYTLEISNAGPDDATGVILVDELPGGMKILAESLPGDCSYDGGTRDVTCAIGTITAGDTVRRTMSVRALGNGRSVTNRATVSGNEFENNAGDNATSEKTRIISRADLEISLSGPSSADRDVPFLYAISVTNNGVSAAENVVVVNTLPAAMDFDGSYTVSKSGASCTASGAEITCPLGTLGDQEAVQIQLEVLPTAEGTFTNASTVSSTTDDIVTTNNGESVATTVVANVDLALDARSLPEIVTEGDTFYYRFEISNTGASDARGVAFIQTLPQDAAFVQAAPPASWSCETTTLPKLTCTPADGRMPGGSSAVITVEVTAEDAGSLTSSAAVSSLENSNSVLIETVVEPRLDLGLRLETPLTGTVGITLTYVLTVTNQGPSEATQVDVSTLLDPDVTFEKATVISGQDWICGYNFVNHEVNCLTAAFGAEGTASFAIEVVPTAKTVVAVEALVKSNENNPADSSSSFDTNNNNDAASGSTTIE